jgi:hypothetical protein
VLDILHNNETQQWDAVIPADESVSSPSEPYRVRSLNFLLTNQIEDNEPELESYNLLSIFLLEIEEFIRVEVQSKILNFRINIWNQVTYFLTNLKVNFRHV